jgi:hypothetical protein
MRTKKIRLAGCSEATDFDSVAYRFWHASDTKEFIPKPHSRESCSGH